MGLGSQVRPKLGRKIEPSQAKTSQDKGRQGKRKERKRKEEEGKGLEGKDVEKCGIGDLWAGGGGVHPTFRGRPLRKLPPLAWKILCVWRRVLWKILRIRRRVLKLSRHVFWENLIY